MGILDFLKPKKTEDSAAPVQRQDAAPSPSPVPAPAPTPARPPQSRPAFSWPRFGDFSGGLIANPQWKVFICASLVRQPAFGQFSQAWKQARTGVNVTRYFFMPAFEADKLSSAEKQAVGAEDMRVREGADWDQCFKIMAEKNLRWNIVLLAGKSEEGVAAQQAAKNAGLNLRWYTVDDQARLKSAIKLVPNAQPVQPVQPAQSSQVIRLTPRVIPQGTPSPVPAPRPVPVSARYRIASVPAALKRAADPALTVPTEGAAVSGVESGRRIVLKKPVMTDSASITYLTSDLQYFAKIYTAKMLSVDLMENKITRMLRDRMNIPGVCWPQDALKDSAGHFVGALVPASRGTQLTRSILMGQNGLATCFPSWDKRDLCRLAAVILDKFRRLEENGVLFGHLNPASIYAASTDEVYFVDMDNWQIEGYPCLSQNQTFSTPESLRVKDGRFLSSLDEEYYQVAVLLFMLLMPGKFPYAKKRSNDELKSIEDMAFPFRVEGRQWVKDAEVPSGLWQIVWDHLSMQLRVRFFNTFTQGGKFSAPGQRLNTGEWLASVENYRRNLNDAAFADSIPLFPKTFHRDGKRIFTRCKVCGQEHPQEYFMHYIYIQNEKVDVWNRGYRICLPCSSGQSNEFFVCECCGKKYYYTNRTKVLQEIGRLDFDFKQQRWCKYCKKTTQACPRCHKQVPLYQMTTFEDRRRNQRLTVCGSCKKELIDEAARWRNGVAARIRCKACGKIFDFTNAEAEFYESKGYERPTRCKECRGKR